MNTRILWTGGVCVFSVLGVVACGSSSKVGSGTTTTPTTVTKQDIAADNAAAQAASLKLTDFPAGWTSQPQSQSTTSTEQYKAQLASCLGVPETSLTTAPASYDSPDFSDSNNNTASSTVSYRATAADQNKGFDLLSSAKLPDCLATTVTALIDEAIKHPTSPESTLPKGVTISKATVSPMSFPQFGDKSIAYQVEIPISFQGLSLSELIDEIFVVKGRASVDMSFQASQNPFPTDQAQHYTSLVVDRLTNT